MPIKSIIEINTATWDIDNTISMYCKYGNEHWKFTATGTNQNAVLARLLSLVNAPYEQWATSGMWLNTPGSTELLDIILMQPTDGSCSITIYWTLDGKFYKLQVNKPTILEAVNAVCDIFDGPSSEWYKYLAP